MHNNSHKAQGDLDRLIEKYHEARRSYRALVISLDHKAAGSNPAKELRRKIHKLDPGYFPRLKELEIEAAITLLKAEGYQVLRRVENISHEEI
jgi:hypothetical protein